MPGHTNVPMTNTDHELVERLLRGDARAFDAFFNEYYPKLYRFVKRRMPRDAAGAEDVAQATLCRALGSLHTLSRRSGAVSPGCARCAAAN